MEEPYTPWINEDEFQALVADAIDHIPELYREKMKHVAIVTAQVPTMEQRHKLALRPYDGLYGLYEGVPLPARGGSTLSIQPDKITLFMHPMIDQFNDKESLRKQVFKTLWHEVAHYFGLNHDQIHAVEKQHR